MLFVALPIWLALTPHFFRSRRGDESETRRRRGASEGLSLRAGRRGGVNRARLDERSPHRRLAALAPTLRSPPRARLVPPTRPRQHEWDVRQRKTTRRRR